MKLENIISGYVRNKSKTIEFNWHLHLWALPLGLDFGNCYVFINILCFSIILSKKY